MADRQRVRGDRHSRRWKPPLSSTPQSHPDRPSILLRDALRETPNLAGFRPHPLPPHGFGFATLQIRSPRRRIRRPLVAAAAYSTGPPVRPRPGPPCPPPVAGSAGTAFSQQTFSASDSNFSPGATTDTVPPCRRSTAGRSEPAEWPGCCLPRGWQTAPRRFPDSGSTVNETQAAGSIMSD